MQASPSNSPLNQPKIPRPPYENFYIYIVLALASFFAADSVVTWMRGSMLPTQTTAAKVQVAQSLKRKQRNDYAAITDRNIFNSDGKIPPPLASEGTGEDFEGPAVPSQLPLTLIGTIVHVDGRKSVATIQSRSNNKILSYKVEGNIEGIAKIMSIERKKVIFRNLSNNRKEYIEIKDDMKINFGMKKVENEDEEVKKEGNRFSLKRDLVLKATANLPELLQQARAVPNIIPNSGGRVEGFRILEMEEGSLFQDLGLKVQDVIKGVNGEPVDSPAKAMELYNALKNSQRIDIEIERNGRTENLNYIVE